MKQATYILLKTPYIGKFINISINIYIYYIIYYNLLIFLLTKYFSFQINSNRILIAASTLAIKFNEDDYFGNSFYAKVGGIRLSELNLLEESFFKLCNYNLFTQEVKFEQYLNFLILQMDGENDDMFFEDSASFNSEK